MSNRGKIHLPWRFSYNKYFWQKIVACLRTFYSSKYFHWLLAKKLIAPHQLMCAYVIIKWLSWCNFSKAASASTLTAFILVYDLPSLELLRSVLALTLSRGGSVSPADLWGQWKSPAEDLEQPLLMVQSVRHYQLVSLRVFGGGFWQKLFGDVNPVSLKISPSTWLLLQRISANVGSMACLCKGCAFHTPLHLSGYLPILSFLWSIIFIIPLMECWFSDKLPAMAEFDFFSQIVIS